MVQLWGVKVEPLFHGMGPCSAEVLNTHLPVGSRELIPSFALLVNAAFAFLIKLNLSLSMSTPDFTLPIPFLILLWGVSKRP